MGSPSPCSPKLRRFCPRDSAKARLSAQLSSAPPSQRQPQIFREPRAAPGMLREDALVPPTLRVWDSLTQPVHREHKIPTDTAVSFLASPRHQFRAADPSASSGELLILQVRDSGWSHCPPSSFPSAQHPSCTLQRGRTLPGNPFFSAPQTSRDITARNADHRGCSKPSSVQLTPSPRAALQLQPSLQTHAKPPDFQSQHGTSQKIEIVPRDATQLC